MKKIASIAIALILVLSFAAVSAGADAYNPNGGCEIDFQVKKADPAVVIKDGVIGADEYEELQINRDIDSTDILLSWLGGGEMLDACEAFLQNIHFYFSWDEVHGLNIAVSAQHLEEIAQLHEFPTTYTDFPGDEFIIASGLMFRGYQDTDNDGKLNEVFYRGVSKRTDNGEYLIGYYWENTSNGLNGNTSFKEGDNLVITYGANNTVVYEMSVALSDICMNPGEGAEIYFDLSVIGGSDQGGFSDAKAYILSLGDEGYCMTKSAAIAPAQAKATLSGDTLTTSQQEDPTPDDPTQDEPTQDDPTTPDAPKGSDDETDPGTTDPQNPADPTAPKSNTDGGNKKNTKTGDAMAVLAVVSALSACGVVIGKKRK